MLIFMFERKERLGHKSFENNLVIVEFQFYFKPERHLVGKP